MRVNSVGEREREREREHADRKWYIKFWEGKWMEGMDRKYVYNLKTIQQNLSGNFTIRKRLKCEYA